MNNQQFGQPTSQEGAQVQNDIKQALNSNAQTNANAGPYNPTTQEGQKIAQDIQSAGQQNRQ